MRRLKCPCCGYYTFESDSGDEPLSGNCYVCLWQYDRAAHGKPDTHIGVNEITLKEARVNYITYGVAQPNVKNRNNKPEELRQNN
jgi:rubredoxin